MIAPLTALADEAAPEAELTVSTAIPPQGVYLMDKFKREYTGCAVDPNADPALAQCSKLDQLLVAPTTGSVWWLMRSRTFRTA